jgi:hypothetical protein
MSDPNDPVDPITRSDPPPIDPDLPTPDYQPRLLRPQPLLLRLLAEHNPFYLLSAACMLASCLALTNSLSWIPIATRRLVTLIITLNVYEAALLAIALFLVTRRRLRRDGRILLLLQAFFLVHFTVLNAEIASADATLGLWVNAILFLAAILKLGIVLRVLNPDFTPLQFAFVLTQVAILFALPCVLWRLDGGQGRVGARHLFVVGWLAALLPALYELISHLDARQRITPAGASNVAPTSAYLALPYLSLLTHIGILHYVYNVPFQGAHAAPYLLGLTLILTRLAPNRLMPRRDLAVLRLLLPAAAVLVSANNPFQFPLHRTYPAVTLTPLNLALAGAFLTYVYCFLRPHARLFLAAGALAALTYTFGPSRRQITDALDTAWQHTSTLATRLVPKTLSDWGLLGLVASFAFLLVGFWISLSKPPTDPDDDGPTPVPPAT